MENNSPAPEGLKEMTNCWDVREGKEGKSTWPAGRRAAVRKSFYKKRKPETENRIRRRQERTGGMDDIQGIGRRARRSIDVRTEKPSTQTDDVIRKPSACLQGTREGQDDLRQRSQQTK